MSRVITFSRKFPSYHYRSGNPTYFVEKFLTQIGIDYWHDNYIQKLCILNTDNLAKGKLSFEDIESFAISLQMRKDEKSHTIRDGNRFKAKDYFSPRCWFGKPYNSPQIIFWEDIQIKNTWAVQIEFTPNQTTIMLPTNRHSQFQLLSLGEVATNDGLTIEDFENWFNPKKKDITFQGQIICWNDKIDY